MFLSNKTLNNINIFNQKRFKRIEPFRNDWLNNNLDKSEIVCIANKYKCTNNNTFEKFLMNNKTTFCVWKDLKSTIFYNEKILISNFNDVQPYDLPPIFVNAKYVFLNNTCNFLRDYWINGCIFTSTKTLFVNGRIDYNISNRYEIYITPFYYHEAKYKNNHIKGITLEDYYQLIFDNEIVEPITETYTMP